jgi:hypothetical protein
MAKIFLYIINFRYKVTGVGPLNQYRKHVTYICFFPNNVEGVFVKKIPKINRKQLELTQCIGLIVNCKVKVPVPPDFLNNQFSIQQSLLGHLINGLKPFGI